jgi:hypothetical protein
MRTVVKMLQIAGTKELEPMVFCPGCKCGHLFSVSLLNLPAHRWTWNRSMDKPTFTPSMLINKDDPKSRCHSVVTDGKIFFCPDSFHELKGKTVDLQPFTEDMW